MGRRKIDIKPLKDDRNRSVTFLKRKGGLFKKAHELGVLCGVQVCVFIIGNNKKIYEYSSSDMRTLMGAYWNHPTGVHEHKGPSDFKQGDDDGDSDDDNGSPPNADLEGAMMPPQFQQAQFPHLQGHTPAGSPQLNGAILPHHAMHAGRASPALGSRPGSGMGFAAPPAANGYAFMPQPPIYNAQNTAPMAPGLRQQNGPPQFPPFGPHPSSQPMAQPVMPAYMDHERSGTPGFAPGSRPISGPEPSPGLAPQPLPASMPPQMSPPIPPTSLPHMSPPMSYAPQPPSVESQISAPMPPTSNPALAPPTTSQPMQDSMPAPLEPPMSTSSIEPPPKRPSRPLLNTNENVIKRLSVHKKGSLFTPIEQQPGLSSHLASFHDNKDAEKKGDGNGRSQSIDLASRPSPPQLPQRASTQFFNGPPSIPSTSGESSFMPLKTPGGSVRPRLSLHIPDDEKSDNGNSPRDPISAKPGSIRPILPPPSPSASTILSAGATGPPNPFAPKNLQNRDHSMGMDTPTLPSKFLGDSNYLASPNQYFGGGNWDLDRNGPNSLTSPLNLTTPLITNGPSFLRDDARGEKRKAPPEGPTSRPDERINGQRDNSSDGSPDSKRAKAER